MFVQSCLGADVFLGVFMVRFYYVSKVRSVPEYLRRRYDSRSHVLNASTFLLVTTLMSGINMYALAIVCQQMLGWRFDFSVFFAAGVVVTYTFLGGLSSSIYNEVLQFFLIVFGFLPLTYLGLRDVGGIGPDFIEPPAAQGERPDVNQDARLLPGGRPLRGRLPEFGADNPFVAPGSFPRWGETAS